MKIAVYGSSSPPYPEGIEEKANGIGREIARLGHTLVTGGCGGLPYEAVMGAAEEGGMIIGFSPAIDHDAHMNLFHYPVQHFSEMVFIPDDYVHRDDRMVCKKYRNVASVASVDAVVIIGGRNGTLNEFTIAHGLGLDIGVLEGSGGIAEHTIKIFLKDINEVDDSRVFFDPDPASLVYRIQGWRG